MIIGPYTKIVKLRKQIKERDETIKRIVAENERLKYACHFVLINESQAPWLSEFLSILESRSGRNIPHNDKPDSPESPAARPAERTRKETSWKR